MAAKYFYVGYHAGSDRAYQAEGGMIVRASALKPLLQAIDEETSEAAVPPELVDAMMTDEFKGSSVESADVEGRYYVAGDTDPEDDEPEIFVVEYDTPQPHPSLESAMEEAREHNVDAPHLYRIDSRGGLQAISIGGKSGKASNPSRAKNSHDPIASTEQMLTTMFHGVRAIEDAGRAKRDNDRRAALGTAQWEIGQAWTHGQYASLSEQDKNDARSYLLELGMLVHEWIADDKKPTAAQVKEARSGAERLAEFVAGRGRGRAAN